MAHGIYGERLLVRAVGGLGLPPTTGITPRARTGVQQRGLYVDVDRSGHVRQPSKVTAAEVRVQLDRAQRAVSAANALLDPSARNAHNGLPDLPAGDQLRDPGRLAAFGIVVLIPAARCPGHHLLRAGSGRDSLLTAGARPARSNSKAYKAEVEISDHCAQSCTSASLSILGTP